MSNPTGFQAWIQQLADDTSGLLRGIGADPTGEHSLRIQTEAARLSEAAGGLEARLADALRPLQGMFPGAFGAPPAEPAAQPESGTARERAGGVRDEVGTVIRDVSGTCWQGRMYGIWSSPQGLPNQTLAALEAESGPLSVIHDPGAPVLGDAATSIPTRVGTLVLDHENILWERMPGGTWAAAADELPARKLAALRERGPLHLLENQPVRTSEPELDVLFAASGELWIVTEKNTIVAAVRTWEQPHRAQVIPPSARLQTLWEKGSLDAVEHDLTKALYLLWAPGQAAARTRLQELGEMSAG